MSTLDAMLATIASLGEVPEQAARDVAAMLDPRMHKGHVDARGTDVAIVPGGRFDAYLSERWADDVAEQVQTTMSKAGEG